MHEKIIITILGKGAVLDLRIETLKWYLRGQITQICSGLANTVPARKPLKPGLPT